MKNTDTTEFNLFCEEDLEDNEEFPSEEEMLRDIAIGLREYAQFQRGEIALRTECVEKTDSDYNCVTVKEQYDRALSLYSDGRLAEAIGALRATVECDPKYEDAAGRLALYCEQLEATKNDKRRQRDRVLNQPDEASKH